MSTLYNIAKTGFLNGSVDLDTDTLKVALVSDDIAYSPNPDHQYVADVLNGTTAAEFSGSGYTRETVAGVSVTQDDTDDEGVADADDIVFSNIDGDTIAAALVYKEASTDADSPLVAHLTSSDFPLPANGGDVTLTIAAEGLINLG